jgi:hypothetical protein
LKAQIREPPRNKAARKEGAESEAAKKSYILAINVLDKKRMFHLMFAAVVITAISDPCFSDPCYRPNAAATVGPEHALLWLASPCSRQHSY